MGAALGGRGAAAGRKPARARSIDIVRTQLVTVRKNHQYRYSLNRLTYTPGEATVDHPDFAILTPQVPTQPDVTQLRTRNKL